VQLSNTLMRLAEQFSERLGAAALITLILAVAIPSIVLGGIAAAFEASRAKVVNEGEEAETGGARHMVPTSPQPLRRATANLVSSGVIANPRPRRPPAGA